MDAVADRRLWLFRCSSAQRQAKLSVSRHLNHIAATCCRLLLESLLDKISASDHKPGIYMRVKHQARVRLRAASFLQAHHLLLSSTRI
jgi:hypothetical protein